MRPLLAYLIVRRDAGSWEVASYRDLDGLLGAWTESGGPDATAAVHIGFWRPAAEAFESALAGRSRSVLLSEAARAALPPSFRSASAPCAIVDGLKMYEALSGWGYERDDLVPVDTPPSNVAEFGNTGRSKKGVGWLALARTSEPGLWKSASIFAISDDDEYVARENFLDYTDRDSIARFRFKCLSGNELSAETILDGLAFAPPWLLALDVKSLMLSTRPANRFAEHKLTSVADIAKYGANRLISLPNMGKGSVAELARKLFEAFVKGSAYCAARSAAVADVATPEIMNIEVRIPERPEIRAEEHSSFATALKAAFECLEDRERRVVAWRMGLDGSPRTLESIGATLNVTRERIRQIEVKALRKISIQMSTWATCMEAKLARILEEREEPLPLAGLDVFDPWFRGAAEMAQPFNYVLGHFTAERRYWLLKIDSQMYVTSIDDDLWSEAVRKTKALLSGYVRDERALPEADAKWLVESNLVGRGEELRPLLWKAATQWANFSVGTNGERLLASFGIGAEHVVEAVLLESDRPLHYEEIANRCAERGRPTEVRRAHHAAANVGILLARGVYGLEKHVPLNEDECRTVLSEAENMLSENTMKQWHAAEIRDCLEERGLDFDGRLSRHVVNFALRSSMHLVYLGRMVWAARSSGSKGVTDRIDVWQAMASMLEENEGPMRTEEIRGKLSRGRGLGETFQLHERDPIIRVGEGTWGMLWRDVPFSESDAQLVVMEMEEAMRATGRGLHSTEIVAALRRTKDIASKAVDPVLLVSLAARTGRMRPGKGGYIYPCDWEGPRRISASAAISETMAEIGTDGATLGEISSRASVLLGREILPAVASRMVIAAGGIYNGEAAKWSMSVTDEPDLSENAAGEGYRDDSRPSVVISQPGLSTTQGV